MRILIAEDDVTSRAMLAAVLRKGGHEVLETADGSEAWEILQQPDAPSLAILDWMMPEMDGLEVVGRIRSLDTDRPPYVIMLTSRDTKTDVIAGLEAGADDYLAKPFDVGELQARVRVGQRLVEMREALIISREALAHQASHDPLTGLFNRRAVLDRLHNEIARSERHGEQLVVAICDIDNFKRVNDNYGHQTGDDVLLGLSKILVDHLREYDIVGRMGGEEFLLVTPIKPGVDVLSIYERLCKRIEDTVVETRTGPLSVTVSIGIAFADGKKSLDETIGAADAALYRAKEAGRNRALMAEEERSERVS